MLYVIDEQVVFRPEDGAMWQQGLEEERLIITPIISRLLILLLEEQGKVLTRDDIMHRVWTTHGLEPSGNSLNQYISYLRRNLLNLGVQENAIKTLPRVGFTFSAEISVEKQARLATITKEVSKEDERESAPQLKKRKPVFLMFIFFLATLIAITCLYIVYGNDIKNRIITQPVFLGEIDKCKIYGVDMLSSIHDKRILIKINAIFSRYSVDCKTPSTVFFHAQNSVLHNKPGRIFVSKCRIENDTLASCKNNVINEWVQP